MRRLVKALAFAIALTVLLAGLAVAVFFSLSDEQHRWITTRVVSALLDSPVEFRGPFSVDLARQPTLTARDVWIGVGPDGRSLGAPVEGRLGVIEIRIDLGALLRGTMLINRLVVESVDIEVALPEPKEKAVGMSWRERVRTFEKGPVLFFETAQLSEVRVMRRGALDAPPFYLELQEVSLQETGGAGGRILLNGDIAINGQPLALRGEFGSLAAARDLSMPYPANLTVLHPAFEATLSGRIEDPLGVRGLDLRAQLEVPDVRALEDIMPRWPWPAGRMSIVGDITGDIETLRLGDLIVVFSDPEGRFLKISGAITDALELRRASLTLTAQLPKAHVVLDRVLETTLPALGEVSLEARLVADDRAWRADDLDVKIAAEAGWSLAGSGTVVLDAEDDDVELKSLALELKLSAPDSAAFTSLAGRDIASLGPVTASGALRGKGNSLEMADLRFRIGEKERLLVTGQGRVDLTGLGDSADRGVVDRLGVDLRAKVEGASEVLARVLLGMDWPDPGPLRAAFQITGNGRQLRLVPQVFAYDGDSGTALRLGATDERSGLTLVLAEAPEIRDLRLPLLVAAPGTTVLRPWLDGRSLPDLGEITGRAVLVGSGQDFGLHNIVLNEGPESQPRIKAAGRIDVKRQGQIDLTADFWADLAALVNPFLTVPLQPLGSVKGHIELSNADGSLGIELLEVASLKDGDARLRLSGAIDDITHFAEADLSLDAHLARLELVRRAFEPDWDGRGKSAFWQQSASFDGRFLAPQPARFASLEGGGSLGGGGLIVDLRLHDLAARPVVNGAIALSHLNLGDFGIHIPNGGGAARADSKWLFPDTPLGLSRLDGASLDLTIAVDDVIDPLVSMQRIDARLVWNETTLALEPAVFVYEGGHVNLDLSIDFTQDPPAHSLSVVGNDMDLGNLLSRFDEGQPLVEGKLTIDAGLVARGSSARKIASSLSGELAFALEAGRLNHTNLALLAPDTFQWFLAASMGKSHSDLSCVIAQFQVTKGVAESDSLFLSAPRVRLAGKGKIDFGKEELDIVLAAPRQALAPPGLSKPVRFHGSLAAPQVQTSATGHAADLGVAAAGVVFMPLVFVPWIATSFLFSQLDEEGDYSPCLLGPAAEQDKGNDAVPAGRWVSSDDGWTLTLSFKGRKARGRIEHRKGGTTITGTVKGKTRSDGIFEGWTAGRQVGSRKIYGRMPRLDMWGGRNGDAASFVMQQTQPQAND
jgi:hypothetical protein